MQANSKLIDSSQQTPHRDLEKVVRQHLEHYWRKPLAEHNRQAFAAACDWRAKQGEGRALLLDSGCGTGRSAIRLAAMHPQALVIGLDQSAARIRVGQGAEQPDNLLLLRAEAADFWRLAEQAGWQLSGHYLLYPNPWPKPGHLRRRWHGHPVFPTLLALGGRLELRSNWRLYVQEFARALSLAGYTVAPRDLPAQDPLTDFERKYRHSGHGLYQLSVDL